MDSDYPPHRLGRMGETLARTHLESQGWTVLAANYRFGRREVDLVVRVGEVVAFVEVKTRAGDGFGGPEAAVTWKKRREIEIVAQDFLYQHRVGDVDVRFDVIAIEVGGDGTPTRFQHIEDAWRPGWR
jgi:putative endonuclease